MNDQESFSRKPGMYSLIQFSPFFVQIFFRGWGQIMKFQNKACVLFFSLLSIHVSIKFSMMLFLANSSSVPVVAMVICCPVMQILSDIDSLSYSCCALSTWMPFGSNSLLPQQRSTTGNFLRPQKGHSLKNHL